MLAQEADISAIVLAVSCSEDMFELDAKRKII